MAGNKDDAVRQVVYQGAAVDASDEQDAVFYVLCVQSPRERGLRGRVMGRVLGGICEDARRQKIHDVAIQVAQREVRIV